MSARKGNGERRVLATNKRAGREYELLDRFEAGIELLGTEVKAIRAGGVQLKDAFVEVRDGEAFLVGAHVSPYTHGNRQNHDPDRRRRLLLKRREIHRIFGRTTLQGLTCVPLSVYLKGSLIKLEIALARGKKLYDKRSTEKKKRMEREAEEAMARRDR